MKDRGIVFFLFIFIVFFVLGACSSRKQSGNKIVKLAVILPISGPNAAAGTEMKNAIELSVEQWRKEKKIPGYDIQILILDDASDPKQAVNQAYRAVGDRKVFAVAAHFNSGCFLPASAVYHDANLLAMTPAATNPKITHQGFSNIFRIVTTDLVQGEKAAIYMKERGVRTISIIHDKTQYGQGLAEVVRDNAKRLGIEVKSFNGINVGDKDFNTLLAQVKEEKPDAVYFGGLFREGGLLQRQLKQMKIQASLWAPDGVKGKDFLDIAGKYAEGAVVSFVGQPVNKMPAAQKFLKDFKARYGKEVENYGPYSYEVANLLLSALKKVVSRDGKWTRKALVREVQAMAYQGILGKTKFDKNGDTLNKLITFYKVKDGKFIPVKTLN